MNNERWWLAYIILLFAFACAMDGVRITAAGLAVISVGIVVWNLIYHKRSEGDG